LDEKTLTNKLAESERLQAIL